MRLNLKAAITVLTLFTLAACQMTPLRGSPDDIERKFDALVPIGTPYEVVRDRLADANVESIGPIEKYWLPIVLDSESSVVPSYFVDVTISNHRPIYAIFRSLSTLRLYFDEESRLIGRTAQVTIDGL